MLDISQAQLAKAAGLSPTALIAIEAGHSDPRSSTLRNIQAALETRRAVFSPDGSVRLGPPMAQFVEQDPDHPIDPRMRAFLARALNIDRRRRGLPLFPEDDT